MGAVQNLEVDLHGVSTLVTAYLDPDLIFRYEAMSDKSPHPYKQGMAFNASTNLSCYVIYLSFWFSS